MKQYNAIKAKHPEALLLFRVGDFYETFGKDAVKTANILGIVLTKRQNGAASDIELAGFPHHALDTYLPKLVRAGQRVAICDQLEDPKMTKTIVKRGVTELVTPGVSFNNEVLDHKANNFLAAIHFEKNKIGISFLDVTTGEFIAAEGNKDYIDKLLQSFQPSEVLIQRNFLKKFKDEYGDGYHCFQLDDWVFTDEFSNENLLNHFGTSSLKGFGVNEMEAGIVAAGAALHYLREAKHNEISHISSISRIEEEKFVWLDKFTVKNLELFYSPNESAITLLDVLDQTVSPMGSRMLRRWMALPLKDKQPIEDRLEVVEHFLEEKQDATNIKQQVKQVGDLERLISKVAVQRVSPREVVQLKNGLEALQPIIKLCKASNNKQLKSIGKQLHPCDELIEKINKEIVLEPPAQLGKGKVINEGVSEELDELRQIAYSGKDYLAQLQQREVEQTGITSLKVGFNNVFGYYLEVTNAHKDKVPDEWHRKQTLTNAERYITEELKEYEAKILGAEEKISVLEAQLFQNLVLSLADYIYLVQANAAVIARIDCLLSFATVAEAYNYTRPHLSTKSLIDIQEGRHPVIEQQLPPGEEYVSNNVFLDDEQQQIMMITGPNMSGKSALLRQTALIVLMAQMGSFVPANAANIGLVDKVFTRVGASDNISMGESTFMVEMNETASILNNLSAKSLVLLDEIGRGTSTYDGVSIAWAITEYIHQHPTKAKTLFATHYHELNEMTHTFHRIKNYNVSVKEVGKKVIFLRKLVEGGSEHSFGIHVAKMAGMPKEVLKRANQVLQVLEKSRSADETMEEIKPTAKQDDFQLSFFQLDDPVLQQIKEDILNTDINTLTPVEALMKLNEIKKLIGG